MSGSSGGAPPWAVLGLGLDLSGPWHQRAVHRSRGSVHTYQLTSSVRPPPTEGGSRGTRRPLRLPSLAATAKEPGKRTSMARLSISEPSLLTPNEAVLLEGLSSNCRHSDSQKRAPPPPFSKSSVVLPCKTCHPSRPCQPHQHHHRIQGCSRPAFIHFSQAIQPSSKPRPLRRHSHNPVLTSEMVQGDAVMQSRHSLFQGEPLSVIGKPCLLSCSPSVAAGPARTQLHVFLPTEAEGEEVDSESVDEGFMDELDCKITSLRLKQGAPKTLKHH